MLFRLRLSLVMRESIQCMQFHLYMYLSNLIQVHSYAAEIHFSICFVMQKQVKKQKKSISNTTPSRIPSAARVKCNLSLRIQICPKKGIFPIILFWGWDWDNQSYSREGSGFWGKEFTLPSFFPTESFFRSKKKIVKPRHHIVILPTCCPAPTSGRHQRYQTLGVWKFPTGPQDDLRFLSNETRGPK